MQVSPSPQLLNKITDYLFNMLRALFARHTISVEFSGQGGFSNVIVVDNLRFGINREYGTISVRKEGDEDDEYIPLRYVTNDPINTRISEQTPDDILKLYINMVISIANGSIVDELFSSDSDEEDLPDLIPDLKYWRPESRYLIRPESRNRISQ
jgi:hypothetical protein